MVVMASTVAGNIIPLNGRTIDFAVILSQVNLAKHIDARYLIQLAFDRDPVLIGFKNVPRNKECT